MKEKICKIGTYLLMMIFLFVVVLFIMGILKLNLIPDDILKIMLLVFILFCIPLCILLVKQKHRILYTILLLFSICFVSFGYHIIHSLTTMIDDMANSTKEVNVVSVYTTKHSDIQSIQDLQGKRIASVKLGNYQTQQDTLQQLNTILEKDYKHVEHTQFQSHVQSLLNEEVDAILLNETAHSLMYTFFPNFDNQVKVIKQFSYTNHHNDLKKPVKLDEQPFTLYITGMDTYGSLETASRSDVNLLLTIHPKTHQILITAIPRDYYIPQTCQLMQEDKLTHTGIFGVDCTIESIEAFLHVDINYFARVNFNSLLDIVDAIGGIDVYSDHAFTTRHGDYQIKKGMNHLNGKQTLGFVRERYALPRGDLDRSVNQMRALSAIIKKATSLEIFSQYQDVFQVFSNGFQTNMSYQEMSSFLKSQVYDLAKWDMKHIQLNGDGATMWTPANGFYAYVMKPYQPGVVHAQKLIQKVFANEMVTKQDIVDHQAILEHISK